MGNPYEIYPIRIADVSRWQEDFTDADRPDINKLKSNGFLGLMPKIGNGRVKDKSFDWFWSEAKGKLQRMSYFYGDYYSHKSFPVPKSNYDWGVEQGTNWYNWHRGDFGEAPGKLDCEPSPLGGTIGLLNRKAYNEVMRPIAETYDKLSGGICEIYCSLGFIPNLYDWATWRVLHVAWYDRSKTKEQIIAECRRKGWKGEIKIWQYASDGDINMDGKGDGLSLGMETAALDLNAFIGSADADTASKRLAEWSLYCGTTPPMSDPEEPEIIIPAEGKIIEVKKVISTDGLNIRPMGNTKFAPIYPYHLNYGDAVEILETQKTSTQIWHRIGQQQWCAELYNGSVFLK